VSGGAALPGHPSAFDQAFDQEVLMSLVSVRRALGVLLTALAVLLALVVLVPALLGFQRYVITSGSMTGTYDRGSLVFDRVVPTASLRAGDVITFRPPGHADLVTHRIHTLTSVKGKSVLTTKGDHNQAADAWGPITLSNARQARAAFHVPYVGYGLAALSERWLRMLLIGFPALLIAFSTLAGLWRETAPEAHTA
jgi:signal peptidase